MADQTGFVDAPARTREPLPTDLPDAMKAILDGRKPGQAFRSSNGKLYRLTAPQWRLDTRGVPATSR